nr:serine/arginine-rich splicing factor RS2Z33-like [Halyomorpha halys]
MAKPRNSSRRKDRNCYACGKIGHLMAQCPRTQCFECGNEGHIARNCPYVYRRQRSDQVEPMEVNAPILRRRRAPQRRNESASESTEVSDISETEAEERNLRTSPHMSRKNGVCGGGPRMKDEPERRFEMLTGIEASAYW